MIKKQTNKKHAMILFVYMCAFLCYRLFICHNILLRCLLGLLYIVGHIFLYAINRLFEVCYLFPHTAFTEIHNSKTAFIIP